MPVIEASASALIDAPASAVYAILADYHNGHPRILPEKYFIAQDVLRGGVGAGTRIHVRMRLLGREQTFEAEISEPEPGRLIAEQIQDERGTLTTFAVDPRGAGQCTVTIRTQWSASGVRALVERWAAPRMLRRIYVEELGILARVAAAEAVGA